jgi:hypothetical protein
MPRKRPVENDETQVIRDKFKSDPDALFGGGEDASVGARRRLRRRERYAKRLADGFAMMNPDSWGDASPEVDDDDEDD